jgi:membrane protein YqaA with SNARE-associated domain
MAESSVRKISRLFFATPQRHDDRLNMRVWFAVFCLFLAAVAMTSNWGFARYCDNSAVWAKSVWLVCLYIFYFAIACTYIPLPTAWFVLFLASPSDGLTILPPGWRVAAVAVIGGLATAISHVNEYHVIAYLLRLGRIHQIRETRVYRWSERQFKVWPFTIQVVLNIAPVPADPSRWLASMAGYSVYKFFLAQWLGRTIRYGFLAVASIYFALTLKQIAMIQAALMLVTLVMFIMHQLYSKRQKLTIENKA